jgi:hypothetical protein
MIPRFRAVAVVALLVLPAVTTTGCTASRQQSSVTATSPAAPYVQALSQANIAYSEAMTAVGQAHARGLMSDEQLERARVVGVAAEAALKSSKLALSLWIATGDPSNKVTLDTYMTEVGRLLAQLANIRKETR